MDGGVATDDDPVADSPAMGDADDFDAWVTARAPSLLRFAYLMTGSQDAAEESLQTALAKACEQWARVRRMDDRDAYVRRMIVNAHVSWWRKFRRRESPVEQVWEQDRGHYSDVAGRVSEHDLVWRLCESLPAKQRASVVLRYYEDLSYQQIARLLDTPEATVRSHVHRALATLRTTIEQQQEETDG